MFKVYNLISFDMNIPMRLSPKSKESFILLCNPSPLLFCLQTSPVIIDCFAFSRIWYKLYSILFIFLTSFFPNKHLKHTQNLTTPLHLLSQYTGQTHIISHLNDSHSLLLSLLLPSFSPISIVLMATRVIFLNINLIVSLCWKSSYSFPFPNKRQWL